MERGTIVHLLAGVRTPRTEDVIVRAVRAPHPALPCLAARLTGAVETAENMETGSVWWFVSGRVGIRNREFTTVSRHRLQSGPVSPRGPITVFPGTSRHRWTAKPPLEPQRRPRQTSFACRLCQGRCRLAATWQSPKGLKGGRRPPPVARGHGGTLHPDAPRPRQHRKPTATLVSVKSPPKKKKNIASVNFWVCPSSGLPPWNPQWTVIRPVSRFCFQVCDCRSSPTFGRPTTQLVAYLTNNASSKWDVLR